jgi:hypothetical protein
VQYEKGDGIMSLDAAEKFVEAWESGDPEVVKAVEAYSEEELIDPEKLADIAGGIGFSTSKEELLELFEKRRGGMISAIGECELSVEDLDQVSGGAGRYWPPKCSSDYDPNSKCAFDDRCWTTWHYYPANIRCCVTFEEEENCFSDDRCNDNRHCYEPMHG